MNSPLSVFSQSIRLTVLISSLTLLLIGCSETSISDSNANLLNGNTTGNTPGTASGNNGGTVVLQPVQVALEIAPNNTFRITWQTAPNATFYRVLENPDGVSGFSNISGDLPSASTRFDHRVALFARVNAQYIVQTCNDQDCVNSNAVMVTGSLNNAITYVKSNKPENIASQSDEFGVSVALSADGNTMAVGAPSDGGGVLDLPDTLASGAGDVYVFVRNGSQWQQQALLTGSNTEPSDRFGYSVSLSADGNLIAVGAPGEASAATGINEEQNDNTANRSGAAYTFVRSGDDWQQQAYIKASNTTAFARFGWDVSLNADGNTLAVGARAEASFLPIVEGEQNSEEFLGRGAVYVFNLTNNLWQQQAFIKTGTFDGGDFFGDVVALSADGNTLAVGNRGEDSAAVGINADALSGSAEESGAAYVYVRIGETWQEQAYIKANNTDARDQFGAAISISSDGNTLAVSAVNEDSAANTINGNQSNNSTVESGAVYVYVREGELWQQQAYIKASNAGVSDVFGQAVSLSRDGNTLAVGAVDEDSAVTGINGDEFDGASPNSGAVYVYARTSGIWQQTAYVKASNTGANDRFGDALALDENGDTLAVGARHEDSAAVGINGNQSDNTVKDAGAVYLY